MRRALISLIIVSFFCVPVRANVVSTGNQNFNVIPSGLDFLTVHSSETLKPGIINLGLFFNNAVNSLPYFSSGTQGTTQFNDHLLGMDLNLGIGLAKNFEIGLSMPFIIAQSVDSNADHGQFGSYGNTEIRLLAKYRFYGSDEGGWAAIISNNWNRTTDNPYIGADGGPIYNFELAWDTTVTSTAFGLNVGYRKANPGKRIANSPIEPIGDQYIASAAMSRLLPKYDLKLIVEIFGGWPAQNQATNPDRQNSSLELLAGVKYDWNTNLALQAGAGTELQHGVSSPDWRIYAGLNYALGPIFAKEPTVTREPIKYERFALSDLQFEFDSDVLAAQSEAKIQEVAQKISELGKFSKIIIEGHTDSIGDEDYNLTLSQKRALTIKKHFVKFGLSEQKIEAYGKGESEPVADNGNFQGRQQNRRVEIEIVK